jgi:hypothetical protein
MAEMIFMERYVSMHCASNLILKCNFHYLPCTNIVYIQFYYLEGYAWIILVFLCLSEYFQWKYAL